MNKTEIFLEEYKKLEDIARDQYGFPDDGKAVLNLEKMNSFRAIKAELGYCREVRNLLQHKPRLAGTFAVEPSDQMIALLRSTIERVKKPILARDVAVLRSYICFRRMEDKVRPAMIEMQEKTFTHIPILDNDTVVGVFSENTLLSYLIDDEIVGIDSNTRFSDLKEYLPLSAHKSESFYFIPQNMLLSEIKARFDSALRRQDRIGLLFMTNLGKSNEPLQGLITAWDVAGAE